MLNTLPSQKLLSLENISPEPTIDGDTFSATMEGEYTRTQEKYSGNQYYLSRLEFYRIGSYMPYLYQTDNKSPCKYKYIQILARDT